MLAGSLRYGVVINAAVRDHVWVLLWLCLKGLATEARCSLNRMENGDNNVGSGFDPRAVKFDCPRLAEGVSWLGAQLGVLYGEGNGRLFAVAAAKEAVLCIGYNMTVGDVEDGFGEKGSDTKDVAAGPVFLFQVSAAITAMYERFSMEEKINRLRHPGPSKYQLYAFLNFCFRLNQALHIMVILCDPAVQER
jgi:U11/U12 small nuclear ribonucleoprotein 48 kDa protein